MNGVPAELITTGAARPLPPEIETTLLRTAQEALANVARHAAASRVALTLSYMEDLVSLDVRDDGAGFDPAAPRPRAGGGFGLAAMRERVHRIAGTLAVESEPGGGTAISACRAGAVAEGSGGAAVIRLLIVDDHPVVRDGLRGMFAGDARFEVVGEAGDGKEALAVARRCGRTWC